MDVDALWRGFCEPPDEARPRAWWHWMDGNVDPEGIRLDLEWLHRVGVRGVQMFDGGMGTPLVVPEKVSPGSPEWRDAVLHRDLDRPAARSRVRRRHLGGVERGGRPLGRTGRRDEEGRLVGDPGRGRPDRRGAAAPAARRRRALPGRSPRGRTRPFAQEWVVLAVPAEQVPRVLLPGSVHGSGPVGDWSCLVDGGFGASLALPRDPDGPSTAWLEQVFDEPVTVASVTVGLPGAGGFGAAPPPHAVLEVSDDGVGYRAVADLPQLVVPEGKAVPVRTVAFPAVTGRRFRLALSGASAADALPPLAAGVATAAGAAAGDRVPRVASSRSGTAGSCTTARSRRASRPRPTTTPSSGPDDRDGDRPRARAGRDRAWSSDGVLRWEAPAGAWLVLRFGASLTGQTNGPAAPEATGLEVDKLDAERVHRYLDTYLDRFGDAGASTRCSATASSRARRTSPTGCASASPSSGATTRCRGCPRSPGTSSGTRTGPTASSGTTGARSRSCWRATTTARSRRPAHARGLTYYAEALEDHRPQLGDDLAMRSHADVPMGAMWLFDAGTGRPDPTYLADLKGASSVAHVYDKPFTGAESMTAFHRPWSYTPTVAQARRRPRARPRRDPLLHPHVPAPAHPGAAARDRPRALPGAGVHPHRAVGRAGRPVGRLPRPVLVAAQPGRPRRRRRRLHRRGGAADLPVRGGAGPVGPARVRRRLREPRRPGGPVRRRRRACWWRAPAGTGCCSWAARATG